jgi:hypothetical protein
MIRQITREDQLPPAENFVTLDNGVNCLLFPRSDVGEAMELVEILKGLDQGVVSCWIETHPVISWTERTFWLTGEE